MDKLKTFFVSSMFLLCGVFMNNKSASAHNVEVQFNVYSTSYEILKFSERNQLSQPLISQDLGGYIPKDGYGLIRAIKAAGDKAIFHLREEVYWNFEQACQEANEWSANCESYTNGSYDFDLEAYELASDKLSQSLDKIFKILLISPKQL